MFTCLLALLLLGTVASLPSTLVVLQSESDRSTHSNFFSELESHHDVTYSTPRSQPSLEDYGFYQYDSLVLMAHETKATDWTTSSKQLLAFVNSGRDVLVLAGSNPNKIYREFSKSLGVDFDPAGTRVVDHFHTSSVPGFEASDMRLPIVTGDSQTVVYDGIGMALDASSELVYPVLLADVTAYSTGSTSGLAYKDLVSTGADELTLAAIFQSRKNTRVTFVGSKSSFSDKYLGLKDNREFMESIVSWTLKSNGMLRVKEVTHFKQANSSDLNPTNYRINDPIEYHIDIEMFNGNSWEAYVADDVQLEVIMLDPQIRTALHHDGNGHYHAAFNLPGMFGMYKFKVNYLRHGYGGIVQSAVNPVHPFRHNEYDRFLVSAYPYYMSSFSMMVGFFLFSVLFRFAK